MNYHFATHAEMRNTLFLMVFDALVLGIAVRTPGLSHLYIEAKIRDLSRLVYAKDLHDRPGRLFSLLHADFTGIDLSLMILGARDVSCGLAFILTHTYSATPLKWLRGTGSRTSRGRMHLPSIPHSFCV